MKNPGQLSLVGWCLLASCAGGTREAGPRGIDPLRAGIGSNSGGSAGTAVSGPIGADVRRSVTMGADAAPSLVVVRGGVDRGGAARAPRVGRVGSGDGMGAGAIGEGSFIVRSAGGGARPSPVGASPSGPRVTSARGPAGLGDAYDAAGSVATRPPVESSAAPARVRSAGAVGAESLAMDRAPTMSEPVAPVAAPRIATGGAVPSPVPVSPVIPPGSTVTVTTTVAVMPPVPPVREPDEAQESAGILTAASVGDADRFSNYLEYLGRHHSEAGEFRLDMTRRLRVRVVDANGRGVNAARLRLSGQQGTVEGLTHADGSYDYFPGLATVALSGVARLDVQVESVSVGADVQIPSQGDGQPVLVRLNAAVVPPPPVLDLGFLIDVTGSMGDELRYVNREIASIVQRVERQAPGVRVRLSATFYRDRVDEMVVQQIPFTTNVQGFAAAMQGVFASGGGDYPEDLDAGLDAAMNRLAWSDGAAVRVLVVVADAPPQHYGDTNFTWREAMVRAQQRGIRLLPVAASGADRRVEFLFRAMGAATSTPYVYLTDDSGVGGPHLEADTDRVAVERFNDALVRLVNSDLRGEGMHEPGSLGAER
jgi:hypothetical protein